MPDRYGVFAVGAGSALNGLAGHDGGLGAALTDADGADRSGRAQSQAVLHGAAADTAGLAAVSHTPAGEKALIVALRSRVSQQQQVVAAYRARDAQLAGLLRSLAYDRPTGGTVCRTYMRIRLSCVRPLYGSVSLCLWPVRDHACPAR